MNDQTVKEALSYALAADLHEEWCINELRAYFERAQKAMIETRNFGQAFRNACYKGEDKRNEVILDIAYLIAHEAEASQCLLDFESFFRLFQKGVINVKRFTKRMLTSEEQAKMGPNYVDGKENILRDFSSISSASQKDNLEAARVVIGLVYDKTMNGDIITPEEREQMGSVIHEAWLQRNPWVFDPVYGIPQQAVPYSQLSLEEQDKDKAQIGPAQDKVRDYIDGLIDIPTLCSQYGIAGASQYS